MTIDDKPVPQILQHNSKSLTVTPYDSKWIPGTGKFVVVGEHPRTTGCLQTYTLDGTDMKLLSDVERPKALRCSSFGASGYNDAHLATGDFGGKLQISDMERPNKPIFDVQAHRSIINAMDAFGGQSQNCGPPEIATCGRDGCVRVWDPRQHDAPVAAFEPATEEHVRDCWTVAFGDSHSNEERCVLAGYDNGDIKLFDLRTNKIRWESNVGNGICSVQFDRKDIQMNKFVAATLESSFHVFEGRTQHSKKGFSKLDETLEKGATIWGCVHLPQCREIFAILSGTGTVILYKYHYPQQRKVKDASGAFIGVAGELELLNDNNLSTQPISSLDWNKDKEGLFVCTSFDQCVRVGFVTKLSKWY